MRLNQRPYRHAQAGLQKPGCAFVFDSYYDENTGGEIDTDLKKMSAQIKGGVVGGLFSS